ncbi:hypothetical protein C7476_101468 [Phyllobacterium bourgognense]|uniref:Uncharacterized protein n=1 Tax=Phyllobacterium bourgognense TaxID=314236 RepID=A0A368Z5H7_9HYPH|nr:hypothetical protein C7476_101468 [Phyllobacterium bourgognense]
MGKLWRVFLETKTEKMARLRFIRPRGIAAFETVKNLQQKYELRSKTVITSNVCLE